MVAGGSREWIVISSDREIADHAWANGSVPVSSDQFLERLNHLGEVEGGLHESEEEEICRRGNPRQLSKREKAIRRALNRL